MSSKMSVQDRIRALNLQNQSQGGTGTGSTPPRLNRSPPRPAEVTTTTSIPSPSPKSPQSSLAPSPSSEKAQLFKAAKVIKKTFDTETDILSRSRAAESGAVSPRSTHLPVEPTSSITDEGSARDVGKDSNVNLRIGSKDEGEIDASEALKFWRTKGITNEGPRSYREAMRDDSANLSTSNNTRRSTASNIDVDRVGARFDQSLTVTASSSTDSQQQQGVPGQMQSEEAKPPSPPDIVRTANAESDLSMEQGLDEEKEDEHDNIDELDDQAGMYNNEHSGEQDDHGDLSHPDEYDEDQEDDDYGSLDNYLRRTGDGDGPQKTIKEDVPIDEKSSKVQSVDTSAKSINRSGLAPLKTDMDAIPKKLGHVRSSSASSLGVGGVPYRAYARRSRLRASPRGLALASPDHSMEIDGTMSVVSASTAYSASSHTTSATQMSTLSSRATRFLKDKKDKRRTVLSGSGGAATVVASSARSAPGASNPKPEVLAKDIAHNLLREKASKERIKQKAATSGGTSAFGETTEQSKGDLNLKPDSPFDEPSKGRMTRKPQTIDLKPAMKTGGRISGLNIEGGHQRQYKSIDQAAPSERLHENIPLATQEYQSPAYQSIPPPTQKEQLIDYPKKDTGARTYFDHTTSMDESSCSALQARDLFDISGNKPMSDVRIRPASARSLGNATLESNAEEFTPLPRGVGKSFDSGCQVFEASTPCLNQHTML